MSRRTSSLRQWRGGVALATGAVLASLACNGSALAAGGAPLPAPDDPPSGHSLRTEGTSTGAAPPAPVQSTAKPTPDAPVVAAPRGASPPKSAATPTSSTRAAATPTKVTAPEPRPRPAKRAVAPPGKRATLRPRPAAKPKPRPTQAAPTFARQPHDANRLGLPLARLVPVDGDSSAGTALLVAAAVLLGASAAGSLMVGFTVRRIAREA